MSTFRIAISSIFIFACTSWLGCANEAAPPPVVSGSGPSLGVTEAQNASDRVVADQLARARCDHEETCNNTGNGKKFASREACIQVTRGSTENDINAYKCPHGVNRSALDHCLAALRAEQCGLSVDTIARQYDCRAGALCTP